MIKTSGLIKSKQFGTKRKAFFLTVLFKLSGGVIFAKKSIGMKMRWMVWDYKCSVLIPRQKVRTTKTGAGFISEPGFMPIIFNLQAKNQAQQGMTTWET